MKDFQKNFIELAINSGALKFGKFVLKSGRQSPYFFNASALVDYGELDALAEILKAKIQEENINMDMIFGPAYKGIFLGSILGTKLSVNGKMPVCFNRKEAKDHGEGGSLIGAEPKGKILIIDDVISSGLAIKESISLLEPFDVSIEGALVTLDRQERGGDTELMASEELEKIGIKVFSVISLDDLLEADDLITDDNIRKIEEYRNQYRGENV